jgi:hypothetical protein
MAGGALGAPGVAGCSWSHRVLVGWPHVQQPGQLTRPGSGVLGHHRQQFQLGHGQRVARAGDPGTAPQSPAQPGDALGQPVGPGTGTACHAA